MAQRGSANPAGPFCSVCRHAPLIYINRGSVATFASWAISQNRGDCLTPMGRRSVGPWTFLQKDLPPACSGSVTGREQRDHILADVEEDLRYWPCYQEHGPACSPPSSTIPLSAFDVGRASRSLGMVPQARSRSTLSTGSTKNQLISYSALTDLFLRRKSVISAATFCASVSSTKCPASIICASMRGRSRIHDTVSSMSKNES